MTSPGSVLSVVDAHRNGSQTGASATFWLVVAWVAVDASISIYLLSNGIGSISRLLLLAGVVVFGVVTFRVAGRESRRIDDLCVVVLAVHAATFLLAPYRPEAPSPSDLYRVFPFVALVGLGVALVVSRTRHQSPLATWALVASAVAGALFRIAIVATDAPPPFDVPYIQAAAGQALLGGSDPYLTMVYHSGYPYLPVAAVAAALGEILGDARWASIGGDIVTACAFPVFAHRVGASRRLGLIMAGLWAWWSGGPYITWQGFPEPILVAFVALAAIALSGESPRRTAAGLLVGLAAATKQFGLGLIPPLLWHRGQGWRPVVIASIGWAIVVAPFALWHPTQFFEGAVFSLVREPGRAYALNLLNWPGLALDPPLLLVFSISIVFGWLCQRGQRSAVGGWLAGSAGLLLLAFALNRIAFVNYFAIPLAMILFLVLVNDARTGDPRRVVSASSPR